MLKRKNQDLKKTKNKSSKNEELVTMTVANAMKEALSELVRISCINSIKQTDCLAGAF